MGVVAVVVFLLLRLTAGDPAAIIAGDNATTQQVAEIRVRLGLDRPIAQQFAIWLCNVLRGDFGESFFFKKKVADLILERLEPTLALSLCTVVLAAVVGGRPRGVGVLRRGRGGGPGGMGRWVLGFPVPVFGR